LKGDGSFVVGICGPWGSGKSSILNMMVGELEKVRRKSRPVVFRFNPWLYSGRDQLLQAFLQQLGMILDRVEKEKGPRNAAKMLDRFSTVLRPVSYLPVVGGFAKAAQETADAVSDRLKKYAEALTADLNQLRVEIDELLREFGHRIVIVMDDVDRLTADEIAQLFSILKAIADFPNTVYVLAFDQRAVSKAIQSRLGVNGGTYLEKIVQLKVDIPAPEQTSLHIMFFEQVAELLGEKGGPRSVSNSAFLNVFHEGIKHFLRSPRACKRLINVLRFTYPPLRGEVHWPDLFGLCCLSVFAPRVYHLIYLHRSRFVGSSCTGNGRRDEGAFHHKWLEHLVPEDDRSAVQAIVRRLFPKVESAMGQVLWDSDWEPRWRHELRICSDLHFDKFFRLSIPEGGLSQAEWEDIIGVVEDLAAFRDRVVPLSRESGPHGFVSRAKEFLDRMLDFLKVEAAPGQAKAAFSFFMTAGEEFIQVEDEELIWLLPIDNRKRILWALQEALMKAGDVEERTNIARTVLAGGSSLYMACELTSIFGYDNGLFGEKSSTARMEPLITGEAFGEILNQTTEMISKAASEGSLADHPSFMHIVAQWSTFGQPEEAREWIRNHASSEPFLVSMLRQTVRKTRSQGMGDLTARVSWAFDFDYLGRFMDLNVLRSRCQELGDQRPSWLKDGDVKLLELVMSSIGPDGSLISGQ
jgi:predicted KAP-like P-loop ATPase